MSNKCLANASSTGKYTVKFVYDIIDMIDECGTSNNGNKCWRGLWDVLSTGGKVNTYGGRSLNHCLGMKEFGGCLNVGGKAATRVFNVVESVFANWVDCNVDTYDSQSCTEGITTIGTQGTSAFWYTMEAMDVCFGGKDADEAEAEMEEEEEAVEEFEDYGEEEEFAM